MKNSARITKLFAIAGLATTMTATTTLASSPTAAAKQGIGSFNFSYSRPRLTVLIHGITPKPAEDPEIGIGTTAHARYYWGFDFIKGLQGRVDEDAMQVITTKTDGTLKFKTTKIEDWHPNLTGVASEIAPICFPVSWNKLLPPGIETNQTLIKDYIRLMTKAGKDSSMVMVNTRDGSKHLMPQVAEAIDEIYKSYMATFGALPENQQPQIYLVGHSFGGIVARAILAATDQPDLFGNKLTTTQIARAKFISERTVLVNTMATPHQGTPMPKVASDAADYVMAHGPDFIGGYYSLIAALPWKNYSAAWVKGKTKDTLNSALDEISGKRDCLEDINRMSEYNAGILKPSTMKRPDGTQVPIYTATGRNPGGTYMDRSRSVFFLGGETWNPISTLDLITGTRHSKNAMALNIIESVLHQQGYGKEAKKPWGTATMADGDRVKSPYMGFGASSLRSPSAPLSLTGANVKELANKFFEGAPYTQGASDGEWDNDGFVGFDSAHGLNLGGNNWYRVFNPSMYGGQLPWDADNHGSIMFNPGNGQWIYNELVREAGPFNYFPGTRRSAWSMLDLPETMLNSVRLDVLEVHDIENNIDWVTQSDFTLRVRMGASEKTVALAEDKRTVTGISPFLLNNFAGSIIPIRIDVIERDQPYDPDDICTVTQEYGQTSLFMYLDTRTGRITGDAQGMAGDTLTVTPQSGRANRVFLKFRLAKQ